MNEIPLFRLRASSEIEEELDWYFSKAASEMGVTSNFGVFAALALQGHGSRSVANDGWEDRRAEAAQRQRRIRARLKSLPHTSIQVLETAYEARQWPKELQQAFGRMTGIAVRTLSARTAFCKAALRRRARCESVAVWLTGAILREERELLSRVRLEASGLFSRACTAYADVRDLEKRARVAQAS